MGFFILYEQNYSQQQVEADGSRANTSLSIETHTSAAFLPPSRFLVCSAPEVIKNPVLFTRRQLRFSKHPHRAMGFIFRRQTLHCRWGLVSRLAAACHRLQGGFASASLAGASQSTIQERCKFSPATAGRWRRSSAEKLSGEAASVFSLNMK